MNISDAFRNKVVNATTTQGQDSSSLDMGRGFLIKLAALDKGVENVLDKLNEDGIQNLAEQVGNLNITNEKSIKQFIEIIKKRNDILKLDKTDIDYLNKELVAKVKRYEQTKKDGIQADQVLKQKEQYYARQKKLIYQESELQKFQIQQWEKNFWGPFKKLFSESQSKEYVKMAGSNIKAVTTSLIGSYLNLTKEVGRQVYAQSGNQLAAVLTESSQDFVKGLLGSAKNAAKALKEGFSEGKQKHYQNLQNEVTKRQEKAFIKFDHEIDKNQHLLDLIENNFKSSLHSFDEVVVNFDKAIYKLLGIKGGAEDNKHERIFSTAGGLTLGGKDPDAPESMLSKLKGVGGAAFSGIMKALPFVGEALSSTFQAGQNTVSILTQALMEPLKQEHEMIVTLRKAFGEINPEQEKLLKTSRNLAYGINFDKIEEVFTGIYKTFGNINRLSPDLIEYQIKFSKLTGISGEETANLVKSLDLAGISGAKNFEDFRKSIDRLGHRDGVSAKQVLQDIAKNTNWIALTSSKTMLENFTKSASQLKSMGLNIDVMMHAMDAFQDINGAMENTFKLNAALGTSFSPMRMHVLALQGDVSAIQKEIFNQLRNVQSLNAIQVRTIAQTLGMSEQEVRVMHEGLKIQNLMRSGSVELNRLESELISNKEIKAKLEQHGYKTLTDQQDVISNRIGELFQEHKKDFAEGQAGFQAFQTELAKKDSPLFKELELKLTKEDQGEKSIQQQLAELQTAEEHQQEKLEKTAGEMRDSLKSALLFQQDIAKFTAMLYGWSVKIAGGLLAGILRAIMPQHTGDKMANIVEEMSNNLSDTFSKVQEIQQNDPIIQSFINSIGEGKGTNGKNGVEDMVASSAKEKWKSAKEDMSKGFGIIGDKIDEATHHPVKFILHGGETDEELKKSIEDDRKKPFFKPGVIEGIEANPMLPHFKRGGKISGPGGPKDDRINIDASNGEYIVNAASTAKYLPILERINNSKKYADGGLVTPNISENDEGKIVTLPNGDKRYFLKYDNGSFEVKESMFDAALKNRLGEINTNKQYNENLALKTKRQQDLMTFQNRNANYTTDNNTASFGDVMKSGIYGLGESFVNTVQSVSNFMDYVNPVNMVSRAKIGQNISDYVPGSMHNIHKEYEKLKPKNYVESVGTAGNITGEIVQTLLGEAAVLKLLKAGKINEVYNLIHHSKSLRQFAPLVAHFAEEGSAAFGLGVLKTAVQRDFNAKELGTGTIAGSFGAPGIILEHLLPKGKENEEHKEHKKANGGLIGSYAKGTMPGMSSIPGFINTNDIDGMRLHKNESVQVMNAQQRVERDAIFEELLAEIRNLIKLWSSKEIINNISLNLDGRELKTFIHKTIFQPV